MSIFSNKKRIKKEYDLSIEAIQLSLYAVFVSILKEDLGDEYSSEEIKEATATTINNFGLREEKRDDPTKKNNNLSKSIQEIANLTLAKEAVALILLFSYFYTDKTEEKYLTKAKELNCSDFETIYNMIDIEKTSPAKVREIGAGMSNTLYEIVKEDIDKNF